MARTRPFTAAALLITTIIFIVLVFFPAKHVDQTTIHDIQSVQDYDPLKAIDSAGGRVSQDVISGEPIMESMSNETLKAELGRASWKLFHTILAQYPEKPTTQQRETLSSYVYLFSRVYPCGQCAHHFQGLLKKFPPQTSSREVASQWGCHIHNQVNERLKKPIFDCSDISNKYNCGCSDEEASAIFAAEAAAESAEKTGTASSEAAKGLKKKEPESEDISNESSTDNDILQGLQIDVKEDLTKGG